MKPVRFMTVEELERELSKWRGNRASIANMRTSEIRDELGKRNIKPNKNDVTSRIKAALRRDSNGPGFTRDPESL